MSADQKTEKACSLDWDDIGYVISPLNGSAEGVLAKRILHTRHEVILNDGAHDSLTLYPDTYVVVQEPADPSPREPASQLERGTNAPSRDHNEQEQVE